MTAFLLLLPADIQVTVFQTWIACSDNDKIMLKALSQLDIACCSSALRSPFLALACHPGLRWSTCDWNIHMRKVSSWLCCVNWLETRMMRTESPPLRADGACVSNMAELAKQQNALPFTIVHVSYWPNTSGITEQGILDLHSVFAASSKMQTFGFYGASEDFFWKSLAHLTTGSIKVTNLAIIADEGSMEFPIANKSLGCFATDHLEKLELGSFQSQFYPSLVLFICNCKLLKVFHVDNCVFTIQQEREILQSCQLLTDRSICAVQNNPPVDAMVDLLKIASKHLIRFSMLYSEDIWCLFAAVLEQCRFLQEVKFYVSSYQHHTVKLTLKVLRYPVQFTLSILQRIVFACPVIKSFVLDQMTPSVLLMKEGLQLIADYCNGSLLELQLVPSSGFTYEAVASFIEACPNLESLELRKCSALASPLGAIARCCPNLKRLKLAACTFDIVDADVITMQDGCRWLKEMRFDDARQVTGKTLQAILDGRRFVNITWPGIMGFRADELAHFQNKAKELGWCQFLACKVLCR